MIKGIINSKVDGREYFVGERVPTYLGKLEVKNIYITHHSFADGGKRKEVFIVEFERGYKLSAPFDDYEMVYSPEVE